MKSCDTGSGGVRTAAATKMIRTMKRHCRSNVRAERTPIHESATTTIGIWNTAPKAKHSRQTKAKYRSIERSGWSRSVPNLRKNEITMGIMKK